MSSLRKLIDEDYVEFLRKKHNEGDSVIARTIAEKLNKLKQDDIKRKELERLFDTNSTRKDHPNRIDSIEELIFRLKEDNEKEKLLREANYPYQTLHKEPVRKVLPYELEDKADYSNSRLPFVGENADVSQILTDEIIGNLLDELAGGLPVSLVGKGLRSIASGFISGMDLKPAYKVGGTIKRKK